MELAEGLGQGVERHENTRVRLGPESLNTDGAMLFNGTKVRMARCWSKIPGTARKAKATTDRGGGRCTFNGIEAAASHCCSSVRLRQPGGGISSSTSTFYFGVPPPPISSALQVTPTPST
jgi:hypothetical protein